MVTTYRDTLIVLSEGFGDKDTTRFELSLLIKGKLEPKRVEIKCHKAAVGGIYGFSVGGFWILWASKSSYSRQRKGNARTVHDGSA